MARLIHQGKTILNEMIYATSICRISRGLMFASKKKCQQGICLVMPGIDSKIGASVTMLFCFHSLEILFVTSSFTVVDKVILKPWKFNYTPKHKCKYVIESNPHTFGNVKIGEQIKIEF